ncbi:MAG: IS200/IS605 family transposase [Acidobacteria bacterium]|nr:IS200/IS605 family transposase [Acidobacteriota bacterium]
MARNVYHEINPHITWHTKHNSPVLTTRIENRLHHYLQHKAIETPGIVFHEIGGTEDHVHLAVSVPPTLPISDWVGKMKGASSHYINHQIANRKILEWQTGYGVVSFGTKDLAWVVRYIKNQKEHHSSGSIQDRLERIEFDDGEAKVTE